MPLDAVHRPTPGLAPDRSLRPLGPPCQDWPEPAPGDMGAIIDRCMADRAWFAEHAFEPDEDGNPIILEDWQRRVMWALDAGETRISIRSGHGIGKTALCAILANHFQLFTRQTKVIVTSPSGSQLKDGLIPETALWRGRLRWGLKSLIAKTSTRFTLAEDPENNFISFRTARLENPEALQGIHADNVMVIVDEASGVPEPVYEAARGTMSTRGAIFILIGNPTKTKELFYQTQFHLRDLWWAAKVSCFDSRRVDPTFIEEVRRTYGENSNQFRIRVLGDFPDSDDDSVIPRNLAEGALGREVIPIPHAEIVWGVDPGRGGDPSGFIVRAGNAVTRAHLWYEPDTMSIAARIHDLWERTAPSERPRLIAVDAIGVGAGVADRLRQLGLPCMDVNVSEAPAQRDRFPRLRAELWFSVRAWLERRDVTFLLPPDLARQLVEELVAPDMLITAGGKTDVESKTSMRSRGVPSPNLADALCNTFAADGGVLSGAAGSSSWGGLVPWDRPLKVRRPGIF
jgi:hypothetical protein